MVADVLAILTVTVAAPLNWLVAVLLWRLSNEAPTVRVLRERALVATALAIIVTVFALIFVNNGVASPPLDAEATKLVTRGTLLIVSTASALFWLRLYRRSK